MCHTLKFPLLKLTLYSYYQVDSWVATTSDWAKIELQFESKNQNKNNLDILVLKK